MFHGIKKHMLNLRVDLQQPLMYESFMSIHT